MAENIEGLMKPKDIWRVPPADLCGDCQTRWKGWRTYRIPDRGINAWAESPITNKVLPAEKEAETVVSEQDLIAQICRKIQAGESAKSQCPPAQPTNRVEFGSVGLVRRKF